MGKLEELTEALRTSVVALRRANRRIEELEARSGEPIAVLSVACRFAGRIDTPEALWALLSAGEEAIGPLPARFDPGLYDPDPDAPGKSTTRQGGFLEDPLGFDPEFFGISPAEAVMMDPQHRLALEVAWEVVERARIAPGRLRDSATGVFLGLMYTDYQS